LTGDPAPRPRFWPRTYVISVRRLHLGLFSYSIALGLTCGTLWLAGLSFDKTQPVRTRIVDTAVLDAPDNTTEKTLRVELTAPPAGNCVKLSEHLLRQVGPGPQTFYPLGSSMSGDGFRTPDDATPAAPPRRVKSQDFVQMLAIPASIPDGQYEYVFRSVYTCLWLGGLIQRRIPYEAPPIRIRVGPP
jgi:hypothetical protein